MSAKRGSSWKNEGFRRFVMTPKKIEKMHPSVTANPEQLPGATLGGLNQLLTRETARQMYPSLAVFWHIFK